MLKACLKQDHIQKIYQKYTKYIQDAGPNQRGDRLYVKRRRLFNREVKSEATPL